MKFFNTLKNISLSAIFILISMSASWAQVPANYYDGVSGSGYALKSNLHNLIDDHNSRTYDQLWTDMQSTDNDGVYENDNTVLDMYSENPDGSDPYNYTWGSDQCGNYSGEESCYNREHSFPKSWFSDGYPMYTDLFHLYPTDGYVNGQRGNFPFGETESPSWTSQNGSKKGPCSYPGYSGTVFEPIDEFKGDFARTYFYMATRYEDVISGWSSDVLDGSSDKVYVDWYLDMMIEWHQNDPVSQKEINRNDAVYNIQGNANPFIDHPEWVCEIWGGACGPLLSASSTSISGYIYAEGNGPSSSQSFSVSGSNLDGTSITVSAPASYEVSLDDTNFGTSQSITTAHGNYNGTDLSELTVYLRLKAGLAAGTYNSENVTVSGGGASAISVSNNGTVTTGVPTLSANPESLSGYTYSEGSGPSDSKSFSLTALDLDGTNVTINGSENYEVSLDDSNFGGSQSITNSHANYDGTYISSTNIFIRLKAGLSTGTYNSESVTVSGGSANEISVTNSGEVTAGSGGGSQACEDFDDQSGSSYETSFTTDDFGNWTALEAGNFSLGTPRSGEACVALNDDKAGAHITTPSFNTVGTVSFWYYQRNGESTDEFQFQVSENGGSFVTLVSQNYNVGETYTEFSYNVNSEASDVKIRVLNDNQAAHLIIDDFCISSYSTTNPELIANPESLSGYSYTEGEGPSASQSFSVSGSDLDGSLITINGSANYEVSLDDINFGASQSISTTHGNYNGTDLSELTVYLRLKAELTAGTYNSENVSVSGGGASAISVSNNGTVTADASTFSVNPESLSGFSYTEGEGPSASQSFSVSGSDLDGSLITINGSANYEVSPNDTNFGPSLNITTAHGNYYGTYLSELTVYVRLKAGLTAGTYNSENVTVSGGGVSDVSVANNGEVNESSTSLSDISQKDGIQIFPNPAKDRLQINSSEKNINSIRIADISGKVLMQQTVSGKQIEISLKKMAEGVYFIEIQTDSYISTKIFIKK
jgi:endonuclease I